MEERECTATIQRSAWDRSNRADRAGEGEGGHYFIAEGVRCVAGAWPGPVHPTMILLHTAQYFLSQYVFFVSEFVCEPTSFRASASELLGCRIPQAFEPRRIGFELDTDS